MCSFQSFEAEHGDALDMSEKRWESLPTGQGKRRRQHPKAGTLISTIPKTPVEQIAPSNTAKCRPFPICGHRTYKSKNISAKPITTSRLRQKDHTNHRSHLSTGPPRPPVSTLSVFSERLLGLTGPKNRLRVFGWVEHGWVLRQWVDERTAEVQADQRNFSFGAETQDAEEWRKNRQ